MTTSPEVEEDILEAERFKARFILATHGAITSEQYDQMTMPQIAVWIEVLNEK